MPIQAQTADGVMHEFPDGTPDEVVDKAVADYSTNEMPYKQFTQEQDAQTGNTPGLLDLQTEAAKGIPIAGAYVPDAPGSKQLEAEHPTLSKVAHAAGAAVALAPAMMAAPALFGASPTASLLANSLAGAGSGTALSAADEAARGGSWTDMGKAAIAGGITGGALPIVGKGIGTVFGGIMDLLKPEAKTIISGMNPLALEQASKTLKASGLTDAQIADKINQLGPEGFLGEVTPDMWGLTKGVASMPGAPEGKGAIINAVENRVNPTATTARIKQGLDDAMGPAENMATVSRELVESRAQGAKDPYEEWQATKITPTDDVKALVTQLDDAGYLDKARAAAKEESLGTGEPVDPMENFFTTGEQKDWPTAASWDKIKQAVDADITKSYVDYRPTTSTKNLTMLKNRIDDIVANSSPEAHAKWMAARDSWAAPSEIARAQERGAQVWDKGLTDDELLYELTNYSPAARAAHKQAARAALEEKLDASVNGNADVTKQLQGKNAADKFRMITGNKTTNPETLLNQMKNETSHVAAKKDLGTTTNKEAFKQAQELLTPDPTEHWLGRLMKRIPYAPHVQNPLAYTPGYGTAQKMLTAKQAADYEAARNVLGPMLTSKTQQAQEYAKALNNYNPVQRGLPAGMATSAVARALAQPQMTQPFPEAPQGYPYQQVRPQ